MCVYMQSFLQVSMLRSMHDYFARAANIVDRMTENEKELTDRLNARGVQDPSLEGEFQNLQDIVYSFLCDLFLIGKHTPGYNSPQLQETDVIGLIGQYNTEAERFAQEFEFLLIFRKKLSQSMETLSQL